jgi:hypothetical protein
MTKNQPDPILELPQGLRTQLEVLDQEGSTVGGKKWLLRDVATKQRYLLLPFTVKGWDIEARPPQRITPSIIICFEGDSIVALELGTGRLYRDRVPPTLFRLKR